METKFPVFERKIEERGIKKYKIAEALDVSYRSLRNKMQGTTPFTWDEACTIQEKFFPDMELKTIFSRTA